VIVSPLLIEFTVPMLPPVEKEKEEVGASEGGLVMPPNTIEMLRVVHVVAKQEESNSVLLPVLVITHEVVGNVAELSEGELRVKVDGNRIEMEPPAGIESSSVTEIVYVVVAYVTLERAFMNTLLAGIDLDWIVTVRPLLTLSTKLSSPLSQYVATCADEVVRP